MAEHEHGSMDATENEKVFVGFVKTAAYATVACIGILVFLAFVGT